MNTITREDGFTLTELMASSAIMLVVLGGALTTFKNSLSINDAGAQLTDSSQNLRTGANMLVHDLMQAGRKIPIGGIPIPSGAGATSIHRPSPPTTTNSFDNVNQSTLTAIVSGAGLGPTVDNSTTDMITFLMMDPLIGDMQVCDSTTTPIPANTAKLQNDGSYLTLNGITTTNGLNWLTGDPTNGIAAVQPGDLIWFNTGGTAIQTVTRVDSTKVYFDANDWFNFNQTAAAGGTLVALRSGNPLVFPCGFTATRIFMYTYYVDATTTPGTPRLTRVLNNYAPQALAGVIEDLDISYDLVDGVTNPTNVKSLPYVLAGLTYTATQVRKVNLHIGVRSDTLSNQTHDYVRTHISTAVSERDLAFVSRYQ